MLDSELVEIMTPGQTLPGPVEGFERMGFSWIQVQQKVYILVRLLVVTQNMLFRSAIQSRLSNRRKTRGDPTRSHSVEEKWGRGGGVMVGMV